MKACGHGREALSVVETHSAQETRSFGAALGAALDSGDVLLLLGSFGVGKTTLVQGLARGMSIIDQVTSPSFVIANEYAGRVPLYHVDLYRMDQLDQVTHEALSEYFGGDGVCVVEWPAAASGELSEGAVQIEIAIVDEHSRRFRLLAGPERIAEVFRAQAGPGAPG